MNTVSSANTGPNTQIVGCMSSNTALKITQSRNFTLQDPCTLTLEMDKFLCILLGNYLHFQTQVLHVSCCQYFTAMIFIHHHHHLPTGWECENTQETGNSPAPYLENVKIKPAALGGSRLNVVVIVH